MRKSRLVKLDKQLDNCKGFLWGLRIPRSILVHDLFGIEIQI